ncbi:MAG: exonuclease [Bdellovibrionaceae bacterium]|nr:exonuclease [Pseudobdellovibrionaceae bacterium]
MPTLDTPSVLSKRISELSFVAFDTETSGAFPIKEDIVEFGAVKWKEGKEVDRIEFLFKPRRPMTDFIIGIHGITNEMVANSPLIGQHIQAIKNFMIDAIPVAHHAPFDMGFLAVEFERARMKTPNLPVICTSLLSRRLIPETVDHKLQTLVKHFHFNSLAAHRAYEDARSCMMVFNECVARTSPNITLDELIGLQGKRLMWENYSLLNNKNSVVQALIQAVEAEKNILMVYSKGNRKNETRKLFPQGIVRSPDGDYLQALDPEDQKSKRYKLEYITDVQLENL